MTVESALTDVLNEALRPLALRRRGSTWYRLGQTLYSVVDVQRSRWDDSCYVNIGFAPADRVPKSYLPESKCLVRFRLDALRSVAPADVRLLNEGSVAELGESSWRAAAAERIAAPVARLVAEVSDLDGLRDLLQTKVTERVFVHRDVRALLDLRARH